jgi:hypothetical protein
MVEVFAELDFRTMELITILQRPPGTTYRTLSFEQVTLDVIPRRIDRLLTR